MRSIDVYVVTFNCGRTRVHPDEFGAALFKAWHGPSDQLDGSAESKDGPAYPELLALSLQEVAPIAYSYLGGRWLEPYLDGIREAVVVATDGQRIYRNIVCHNTGMTAVMVFARQDVAHNVAWIKAAGVGTGVQDTGHKGAAAVRLGYYSEDNLWHTEASRSKWAAVIELTFVAAHLAPGEAFLERRNEDWKKLARRLVFSGSDSMPGSERRQPSSPEEEVEEEASLLQMPRNTRGLYSPRSYLFVAGDFNYRTANTGPRPEDCTTFPQPTDDPRNPLHYSHLLRRDQLTRERASQRTFHGLFEMPITFPPTYKIIHSPDHVPAAVQRAYNWAQNRWPSWCDRVLYAEPRASHSFTGLTPRSYTSLPVISTSDHRPVAFAASLSLQPIPATDVADLDDRDAPFEIDAAWQSSRLAARRKEILAGVLFYLALTREGNVLALITVIALGVLYRSI